MVEVLNDDNLFHVRSFFSKTKQEIDTFSVHSQLIKLLNDTRVITKKGEQKEYTHTTIPSKNEQGQIIGGGKYNFSDQVNNNKLKDLLTLCIEHNYYPSMLSLTQKIGSTSCVHIDLDFRYPSSIKTRQYCQDNVSSLLKIINNCIMRIYNVPKEKVNAYVFERRSGVVIQENITKDGIHLLYPEIITNTKTQYALREEIIKEASHLFKEQFKSTNSPEDIVDKAVIENSNWMLYGARKIDRDPYELTHVFSYQKDYKPINTRNLLDYFDFLTKTKDMELPINENYKYLMSETYQTNNGSKKNKTSSELKKLTPINNRRKINVVNSSDLQEIKSLVSILNEKRADNHETWVRVGWCLYNIDKNNLLDDWIKFSAKSPKEKIKSIEHGRSAERCMTLWNEMKRQDSGLGIGSLHRWAKEDNTREYEEIRRNNLGTLITKSMSVTTYDVARVIYEMYKYNFKCISYKENKWYEFQPSRHRWIIVEKAHSLIKLISEDVVKQYLKSIYQLNKEATAKASQLTLTSNNPPTPSPSPIPGSNGSNENIDIFSGKQTKESNGDDTLKMVEDLVAVTYKLRDISFKEKLVKECGTMFGENAKQFLEAIDANPYLIGFDNGVYDLQSDEFRDGRPEDYLTFSTGYDYVDFGDIEGDEIEEEIKETYEFFDQVFPQKAVREYILLLLSSFLGGTTRDEKFHIWTGCHAKGTGIMMHDGTIKKVEEISIGDQLMGPDSKPRNVNHLVRGNSAMYAVTPSKGEPFVVNGDHILSLKATKIGSVCERKNGNRIEVTWQERDTQGYPIKKAKNFPYKSETRKAYKKNVFYYETSEEALKDAILFKEELENNSNVIHNNDTIEIPLNEYIVRESKIGSRNYYLYKTGITFDEKEISIDPYIVGYWLGDGHSNSTAITTADNEVIEYFDNILINMNKKTYEKKNNKAKTVIYSEKWKNKFLKNMKSYNLINNKHIPEDYLHNSKEIRLQVLAGLIDSDGHYNKRCNHYEITLKSEQLSKNILYLVRSIGFAATMKAKQKKCHNNGKVGTYYMIIFYGNGIEEIPVKLERKQAKQRIKNKDALKYGFKVKRIENGDYYGFNVNSDHLYLTEDFMVHHNCGSNGKSKLLELIEFALGDYACKLSNTVLTRKQGGSSNASPDIEQTKGKRLASIQETEQDDMVNVGRMKELSGGDKIYARGLFKDPIQFKPQFKMILLCNELPKINADDNGTWRRIRVVKFISRFTDNPKLEHEYPIDPMLSEKIHKWKEAFMYILLQKYKKYKKHGLKEPEEVLEVTREYQRVSDMYNDFMTDTIVKDEKSHIGLNELYRVFKEWFRNNNNQSIRPPTRTYFKGKMEQKLGQKYEHNKWTGYKIVGEDEDTEEDD